MKISVVIPAYNSAKFIPATLESVLKQTLPADEILVMDDGSNDNTVEILRSYQPRVTILQQKNRGVAASRNVLAQRACGDFIAFLDHDDLWHPKYLETQGQLLEQNPDAVASFVGHVDFEGYGNYEWPASLAADQFRAELIEPLSFLKRYNASTGLFGSMSFCCVPKRVLTAIGAEPFRISGVDDSHLSTLLPLFGPVVYAPMPLVAYRVTSGAQSANRLKGLRLWVQMFELLEERYEKLEDAELRRAFQAAFASKRRWFGKLLMGAGDVAGARGQFAKAMRHPGVTDSLVKSFALWFLTHLPAACQPAWPSSSREAELSGRLAASGKV